MLDQPEYGRRLRHLRRQRGMSQTQLAGVDMSPSYISLVETGRRTPSKSVAQLIADRLGVPPREFDVDGAEDHDERTDLVGRLLAARGARKDGDLTVAAKQLEALAEQARSAGENDVAWEALWELAETFGELDDYLARDAVLTTLLEDPLTQGSARLSARVATAASDLALCWGHLADAVRAAEQASAAADALEPGVPERVRARLVLAAAYTDRGDLDRAADALAELLDGFDQLPTPQLRGLTCWVAADLQAANGRPDQAVPLLDQAAELLPSRANLRLSAQLGLTTVGIRLLVDDNLDAVNELLQRVGQTFQLIGTEADRVRLATVEAGALLRAGQVEAAVARAGEVGPVAGLPPHELARCLMVAGEIQRTAGLSAEAESSYHQAAELFDAAGAFRRASQAWRAMVDVLAGKD